MALSDLISRPIAAPLEGFDKAVGVGFELAQKQEQLKIANEELKLRQEQVQSEYLSKGMNALGALSKAKGPAKKMMMDLVTSYFTRGGIRVDPGAMTYIGSDEENIARVNKVAEALKEESPVLRKLKIQQIFESDPEQLPDLFKSIDIEEEAKIAVSKALSVEAAKKTFEASLEGQKAGIEKEAKAEEQFAKDMAEYGVDSEEALQVLNPKTAPQRVALLNAFKGSVGNRKKFAEENIKNLKDLSPEQQKRLSVIQDDLNQAAVDYWDPNKRAQAISKSVKADKEFKMIMSQQKSSAATAEKLMGMRISEARAKDAGTESRNIQKDVSKYFDEKATAINKSLSIISKPNATWNDIKSEIGSFARLGGTVGAQSDRDVRNALGTGFGPMAAEFATYFDTDAEPDPSTLKRLKANAKIALEALAKGKEAKIAGSIAALQEDPRLGTYFRPGGAQYNALSARYPQVFESINKKKAQDAVKSAVSNAAKSPVTVTRSQVVQKLKEKALKLDPSKVNYQPSAREIDAAFETYKAKYGPDGVIIMKDK